jgi:hypothetical protein
VEAEKKIKEKVILKYNTNVSKKAKKGHLVFLVKYLHPVKLISDYATAFSYIVPTSSIYTLLMTDLCLILRIMNHDGIMMSK